MRDFRRLSGFVEPLNFRLDIGIGLGDAAVLRKMFSPRVRETAEVLLRLDGRITERIYRGMGHTINEDEIKFVRVLLAPPVTQGPRHLEAWRHLLRTLH